jgi:hypothetical protein
MCLATKFQLKPGQTVAVFGDSRGAELELGPEHPLADDPATADATVVFAANLDELERFRDPLVAAAGRDALTWLAYPKAGQLGTDLNRDSLRELLTPDGIQPVRQVAIDEVWSGLRFRPAS